MVTLKLKVTPEVFAKLHAEIKRSNSSFRIQGQADTGNELGSYIEKRFVDFVRILPGDRKFDGSETEIVLELADRYPEVVQGQNESVQTDRKMLDLLCDMIGVFPRGIPILSAEDLKRLKDAIGRLDFLFGWTLRNVEQSSELNQDEFQEMKKIISGIRTLVNNRE